MSSTAIKNKTSDQHKPAPKPASKSAKSRSGKSPRGIAPRSALPMIAPLIPAAKFTKRDQLAALLVRDEGATLEQMIFATSWLPHTTRAAMTGLRKAGYAINSDKIDGVRTYRAVAPQ